MYEVGDKVYIVRSRPGFTVAKGSWGYVTGHDDEYDEENDQWVTTGVEIQLVFERKKGQKKGVYLPSDASKYIVRPFDDVMLYSQAVSPQEQVLAKIKVMQMRQSFKFKENYCD